MRKKTSARKWYEGLRPALILRRLNLSDETVTIIMAAIVGLMGGYGAVGFIYGIRWVQGGVLTPWGGWPGPEVLHRINVLPLWALVLIPGLGGLLVGPMVTYLAKEAKGHGVPEVMEAMALRGGRMRPRVAFVKIIASALTIGTGGSVGREGPIVQIGAGFGSIFGMEMRASTQRLRRLVACGAAAGIAAAFNAPIAGAMFSLEIILDDFALASFAPIVLASVAATVVTRYYLGPYPTFEVPHYSMQSGFDLIAFTILGPIAGFLAWSFVKFLYWVEDGWDRLPVPDWTKPGLGGALTGVCIWMLPDLWGGGYESMTLAMLGKLGGGLMLLLVLGKILATSLTIGSGGSGGIFAPSLFMGCMMGGAFGLGLADILPPGLTASPGAYALVGMGAVVAGTTHAPITAIMILFELTDSYALILPIMTACILSSMVSRFFSTDSIYTTKLTRQGIVLEHGRERQILSSVHVRDVMSRRVTTIPESTPFSDVKRVVTRGRFQYFPVVDDAERLKGILSFNDVRELLLEDENRPALARDMMREEVVTLLPNESLLDAMRKFGTVDVEQLPVVSDPEDRIVMGILSRGDILRVYNREVLRRNIA